jgi:nicotinate-nucleotide pyrophosphorylase (carboxylating)
MNELRDQIRAYLAEDNFSQNLFYYKNLPNQMVNCQLKFKEERLVLSGSSYFSAVFRELANISFDSSSNFEQSKQSKQSEILTQLEGQEVGTQCKISEFNFQLPFSQVLTGERLALNLLQRSSAIATQTKRFVDKVKASGKQIAILDTRKTTPGLRTLEKHAVRIGGGHNHRFSQVDTFMIKDNHKEIFGGLEAAVHFFRGLGSFYTPIVVEIHHMAELPVAAKLGLKHLMLDNFSPAQVREAIQQKVIGMTYEVSGGINLSNIDGYLLEGVDAISIGGLTHGVRPVDISLKFHQCDLL